MKTLSLFKMDNELGSNDRGNDAARGRDQVAMDPRLAKDFWINRDVNLIWHGFTQMSTFTDWEPVIVKSGDGRYLESIDGKRYFDAISSLWVTTLGHRIPELNEAIADQLDQIAHSTLLGNGNTAVVELAEQLARVVPVTSPHFLFASDGASAVEQAIKIAFQYWRNKGVRGRETYLSFTDAYHGDTIGAMSIGDRGFGTSLFDPLRFEVIRSPGYQDQRWLEKAERNIAENAHRIAAVVIEPVVQAASGMHMTDPAKLVQLAEVCTDHEILLIFDEVATGFGRTGKLFASELCGVHPDILCIGKGLTGGYLPMSATVASEKVYKEFLGEGEKAFYHGHSYGGNALAAAVAKRHLELMDSWNVLNNVTERAKELSNLLDAKIKSCNVVQDIRHIGLMCGIEITSYVNAPGRRGREICAFATRNGVLLRPLGDVIVLMPPLTTTGEELEMVVDTLQRAIVTNEL